MTVLGSSITVKPGSGVNAIGSETLPSESEVSSTGELGQFRGRFD